MGVWGVPSLICLCQRLGDGCEIAVGVEERLLQAGGQRRRRLIGHEMPRQLAGDMARRGRMDGECVQHVFAGLHAAVGIALAQHGPLAGLVARGREEELARLHHRVGEIADGPAREDAGKVGHVLLGVAAADAQRVQLQDLARRGSR